MTLLHIAEPGMSTAPHQHRRAIGIDLGTTNSLVASIHNGANKVLPDAEGRVLLPSVARYVAADAPIVGHAALADAQTDPANTIISVKRFMGRSLRDIGHAAALPYQFIDNPGMVSLNTVAGEKSPVEVSAEILKVLRARAEESLGGELSGAVITVPAYFDDAQRQATRDAAQLAGLQVLRLLNEPTAAAIAYGLDNATEGVYAVYDLGGGTFDISILRMHRGVFEVLATAGDSALGGDDFDRCIVDWILQQAQLHSLPAQDTRQLLSLARRVKESLSAEPEVMITTALANSNPLSLTLRQTEFWKMTQRLVQKTLAPTRRALRDSGLAITDVKGVVLVGGATRMPHVRQAVAELFGQPPLTDLDPDQIVALGAAIQANALAGNHSEDQVLLLDVIPLSLGIETMGGLVEKIIPRNSTIPVARAQEFTTFKDGQTAMSIHAVQGERELVSDCRSLAHFSLKGIPAMAAGTARIRVTFQVDADGLLSVSAREISTGVETSVAVKPSYGLSDAAITRMLQDSQAFANADAEARALRELQIDAQRLLDATLSALAEDGETLLSAAERAQIGVTIHSLQDALTQADRTAIRTATENLNQGTTEFAARRMNRNIHNALTGRTLAEVGT